MKDLAQYPVTFPYGSTTSPYTSSHPHRGNDRAAPLGTPIVVCGKTIGFVGMTGKADGYHCHTQEWRNNHLDVRKPLNEFKPGTVTEVDVDGTTGDKSFGKYVTIRSSDGWSTTYCHMNMTNAKVGDIIGEEVEMTEAQAREMALRIGLLGLMSEAQVNDPAWMDYQWRHIQADPYNYPAGLAKQIYDGHDWQLAAYKAGHYDEDVAKVGGNPKVTVNGKNYIPEEKK